VNGDGYADVIARRIPVRRGAIARGVALLDLGPSLGVSSVPALPLAWLGVGATVLALAARCALAAARNSVSD
jgi:hypothetical protein